MSAASCASGDFNPYLRGLVKAAETLAGQAREAAHGHDRRGREAAGTSGAPARRALGPAGRLPVGEGLRMAGPGRTGGPGRARLRGAGLRGRSRSWWPGPPAPPRGPKAGRGDVRAAILALLREGPRNGYQIMSEIEERSGGAWRPSPGAVYPALQLLADEGLIAGEEAGGRRTFSLTEAGRQHIEEDPERARPAWEAMAQDAPGEMPGLFAQAARLGGSIVQLAHAGTPEQIRAAEQLLERTRRQMYQILASDEPGDADDAMTRTTSSRRREGTTSSWRREDKARGPAMDDRIRASDADRERVTARLRDHYAEGRLTAEELDERTSAALNAKTFGDLRRVMTDLPDPLLMPAGAPGPQPPGTSGTPWLARRRGPRFAPLLLLVLLFVVLAPGPGAWVLFGFFKLFLLFWLVTGLAAFVFARRSRRRMSQGGPGGHPPAGHGRPRWE